MSAYTPSSPADGVPESRPESGLKLAHGGLPAIENASGSPSASEADGANSYAEPTVTEPAGVPEIVGAVFGTASTVIENSGSETVSRPSVTLMRTPEYTPSSPADGVPDNVPLAALKSAQDGRPAIEKLRLSPSGSLASGLNT